MQNNPTEYLKPHVVDVEVITPLRAQRNAWSRWSVVLVIRLGNALRRVLLIINPWLCNY